MVGRVADNAVSCMGYQISHVFIAPAAPLHVFRARVIYTSNRTCTMHVSTDVESMCLLGLHVSAAPSGECFGLDYLEAYLLNLYKRRHCYMGDATRCAGIGLSSAVPLPEIERGR